VEPAKSRLTASTLLLVPLMSIQYSTVHSLSKYESRLYNVIGGSLVSEIWRLPGSPLVTSPC